MEKLRKLGVFGLRKKHFYFIVVFLILIAVIAILGTVPNKYFEIAGGGAGDVNYSLSGSDVSASDVGIPPNDSSTESESAEPTSSANDTKKTTKPTKAPKGKLAYLTFDDGPSENTFAILDILDEYNIKATFFVIGKEKMGKQYKEIVKRGHAIALHTYSHSYKKIYKSEAAFYKDLEKIRTLVKKETGVDTKIFRFPGGSSNTISKKYSKGLMKKLIASSAKKGYIYHDWNVDSGDGGATNLKKEKLLSNIKRDCKGRDVIDVLMHDSGKTKQTTVEALRDIIDYLKSEGYKFLPIDEGSEPVRHKLRK